MDESECEERHGSDSECDALQHRLQLVEEVGGGVTETAHAVLHEGRRGAQMGF